MIMEEYRHILVYGEINDGHLESITKELLGGGRYLADQIREDLIAVFIGESTTEAAREAYSFGADKVYVVRNPKLDVYDTEMYVAALSRILEKEHPRYILFGHTDRGADVGTRLSFRLNVAIATDCVELSVDEETKHLIAKKPIQGGIAMALYSTDSFPQMTTVRAKSMIPMEKNGKSGIILFYDVDLEECASRTKLVEKIVQKETGIRLEDAEIIVSGGRGIGDAEGFKKLEEVTKYLKAALGASRVACDNEWASSTIQVGITGKIVAPKVYLAVGISGASQHMTGCSRSKTIVAINKDPKAPIFNQAHFGVVGDWKIVLPAFMKKLKAMG